MSDRNKYAVDANGDLHFTDLDSSLFVLALKHNIAIVLICRSHQTAAISTVDLLRALIKNRDEFEIPL